jgi:hypothetical protein
MIHPYHFFTGESAAEPCTTCELDWGHVAHRKDFDSLMPAPDFNEAQTGFVEAAREYMKASREYADRVFIAALAHARVRRLKENAAR